MSVYIRILKYLEPYRLIFIVSLAALTLGALLDGFSMILLIPFLRSLFGEANILTETGGLVDRVLDLTVGGGDRPGESRGSAAQHSSRDHGGRSTRPAALLKPRGESR